MRRKELLIIILLIAALLPYFVVCFYALPFADDFCFAWTSLEKISFVQRFLRQYLNFCGRYSADAILCIHPLASGRLIYNQSALFISLVAILIETFLLARFFILDLLKSVIIAFLILLFYLCYMPQLAEGVYWFTGICNYGLGLVLLLFHLVLLLLCYRANKVASVLCMVVSATLLIAAIGINELNATLLPAYYLLAVIVFYRPGKTSDKDKRSFQTAVVFFAIAVISSAFAIFSPGNFVRSAEFSARFNFFHSTLYAAMQTARFTVSWFLTIPALLLSTLIIIKADKFPDTFLFRFDYKIILALALFTVFMGSFLPYFGTGILGQHRTINYVFFLFILLWIWFLISFSKGYGLPEKAASFLTANMRGALVVASILCMIFTGNSYKILSDFRCNNFIAYKQEFMFRQADIIQHPEMEIPALKNIPQSFEIVDARGDSTWWVNKCMKYFYRDTRIELR